MKKQITGQATTSIAFKVINTVLGFVVAIVLVRRLGPDGYGIYVTTFAIASTCAILVQFGMTNLVLRETALAEAKKDWGKIKAVWSWSSRATLISSFIIITVMTLLGISFRGAYSESQITVFFLSLGLIPLIALNSLRNGALRGLQHTILAQIPDMLVKPTIFLLLVILLGIVFPIAPLYAVVMQIVATGTAFLLGAFLLWRKAPNIIRQTETPNIPKRNWWIASATMALSSGMYEINNYADVLILGLLSNAEEVGLYRVAYQVSLLVLFGLQAFAIIITPHFARLYQQDNLAHLQRVVTLGARIATGFAVPVVAITLLFGDTILELVFGAQFKASYEPLAILVTAQLANAFFGAIGMLLNMVGLESKVAKTMSVAAICNIVLNFILIPIYGKNGAAIATLSSLLIWNIWLWHVAFKRLGINCSAIGTSRLI